MLKSITKHQRFIKFPLKRNKKTCNISPKNHIQRTESIRHFYQKNKAAYTITFRPSVMIITEQ